MKIASRLARYLKSAGLRPTLHHAEAITGENRLLLDKDLGIYSAPFAILKAARMPAILFEVGVIAHPAEEQELDEPSYRARIQSEVLAALMEHCKQPD